MHKAHALQYLGCVLYTHCRSWVSYPLYAYENAGSSCSIIAAAFYRPTIANFPEEYDGRYFFGDYCGGFIRTLSAPSYSMPETFTTGVGSLFDLDGAADRIDFQFPIVSLRSLRLRELIFLSAAPPRRCEIYPTSVGLK